MGILIFSQTYFSPSRDLAHLKLLILLVSPGQVFPVPTRIQKATYRSLFCCSGIEMWSGRFRHEAACRPYEAEGKKVRV